MISCGEPSGDLYAAALASEIRRLEPSATITGFGGDRLAAAGATLVENFSGLSVTGLLEVVRLLPRTYATYRRLLADADAIRPDVFVAIDFPDFNFILAPEGPLSLNESVALSHQISVSVPVGGDRDERDGRGRRRR